MDLEGLSHSTLIRPTGTVSFSRDIGGFLNVTCRFDSIGTGDLERVGCLEELGKFVLREGEGDEVRNWLQGSMRWPDCALAILRRPTRCSLFGTYLISRALASSVVYMCIFPGRRSRMQLEAIIDCSPRSAGMSESVMAVALYLKLSSDSMPWSATTTTYRRSDVRCGTSCSRSSTTTITNSQSLLSSSQS